MRRVWRTTVARIVLGVAVLVGLYALAGFVIAPKLVRSKLLAEIPRTLNVAPAVGDIRINPARTIYPPPRPARNQNTRTR